MLNDRIIADNSLSCDIGISLKEASLMLMNSQATRLAVLEKNRVKGLLTIRGVFNAFLNNIPPETEIKNYLEEAVIVSHRTNAAGLLEYNLDKIVLVDDNQCFLGFISTNKLVTTLMKQFDNCSCNIDAILSASSNCILSIDTTGAITYLNESAEKMINVTMENVLGQHVRKFIPNTRLPEVVKTGQPEIGHHFLLNDITFITNRTPVISNGAIVGAVAVFQDITELQNVIEELTNVRKYKETLETVVENDDCIVVVDTDGIITMFNKAYEEFLGISKKDVIGKHITEVIENTRMHIVCKTGIQEIAQLQKIKGQEMVCNRIPIKRDGKIIAALGKVMFKNTKEITAFVKKFNKLEVELEYYKDMVKMIEGSYYIFDNIIGSSPEISEVKSMAQRAAQSNSTVLIRGESGTGKELFAHAIHNKSLRKNGPFIKVNCAAIPENLMESELFGYEEGAFTGAKKGGKPGKIELANHGTLFLDEIGDMPLNMQIKVLRVLQEKEFERVGGTTSIPVNVRVIAATNRNLEELIKEKLFRIDLYYRLNVVELRIPPLRHHKSDIEELSIYLLSKLSEKMGCPMPVIDQDAMDAFMSYNWPGNIREMENVLERCLNFIDHRMIKAENLPYHIKNAKHGRESKAMELKDHLEETERLTIINALKKCDNNKISAAKILGISRASLYQKIAKHNIGKRN